MKIVDCSHTITPEIPLWPGTKPFECSHIYTHDDVGVVVVFVVVNV
jgi:kynurenine formamidase